MGYFNNLTLCATSEDARLDRLDGLTASRRTKAAKPDFGKALRELDAKRAAEQASTVTLRCESCHRRVAFPRAAADALKACGVEPWAEGFCDCKVGEKSNAAAQ